MPKIKTNRGANKRFKVTGSGALKHRRANRNHILTKKAQKRKRHLRKNIFIADVDIRGIKRLLVLN